MNALVILWATGAVFHTPSDPLQVREAIVDRGDVKAGAPLTQSFALNNRGATPIVIGEIVPGCGCMKPRLSKKTLDPGESAELEVDLNTLAQPTGVNTWIITVGYQYGQQPALSRKLELRIEASIVREIDVEPIALHMSIDREATHTIAVTDRRAKPLTITAVRCNSKFVKVQLIANGRNGRGQNIQQVRVTILESCPPGTIAEDVVIVTDDADYSVLRVPLSITRKERGRISFAPSQLDLRLALGQTAVSGLVRLRDPDDKLIVVDKIESDNRAIRTKWAAGPGAMATLRLGVELMGKPVSGQATVKVHIKEPKPQILMIPISWEVP